MCKRRRNSDTDSVLNENVIEYLHQKSNDGMVGPCLPRCIQDMTLERSKLEDTSWMDEPSSGLRQNDFTLTYDVKAAADKLLAFFERIKPLETEYRKLVGNLEYSLSEARSIRTKRFPKTHKSIRDFKQHKVTAHIETEDMACREPHLARELRKQGTKHQLKKIRDSLEQDLRDFETRKRQKMNEQPE